MKNLAIKTKSIRNIFFIVGMLLLVSCKNDGKRTAGSESDTKTQNSIIEKDLLIGSWKDTSESELDFTLFKDGTASSDNMKTLLYKNWNVDGNEITFVTESIGNGTSSTDTLTYIIEKLSKNDLILRDGTYLTEYTKK